MKRLRLQVRRIGPHFRTVLVTGETGTGKELVARALHGMSARSGGPFVVCHPDDSLDIGRLVQIALRGTLFLDGINKMPLKTQGRLLTLLKQHEASQICLNASQGMGLRMIVSTNEDLRILVATGRLRQELYRLLATVEIAVPPLRERMEDLPELARCFLARLALLHGKDTFEIANDALEWMKGHHWPGNVSELEDMLRKGLLRSRGKVIGSRHLPMFAERRITKEPAMVAENSARLHDVVEQHVLRVLRDCRGNKLRAAEVLGISRSTLYRMLNTCTPIVHQ